MRKNTVIALAAALVLSLASFSYAKYVSGYKVVGVSEQQVTIQKGAETPIDVQVKKAKFKVGDNVLYDEEQMKLKLKKGYEGC
jgi:hypothetical protein